MIQLIFHLLGDYVFQSDWMASNKTKQTLPALVHALIYSLLFLSIGSWKAWLVIFLTHLAIDRFRLARFVVFAKEFIGWPWPTWNDCSATGYPSAKPAWLAVWLMIAADNTLHLVINYGALKYL